MSNLLVCAIPGFLLSLWLERLRAGRHAGGQVRGFETRDTLASLGMGVGNVIISTLGAALLWQLDYRQRLINLGLSHAIGVEIRIRRPLVSYRWPIFLAEPATR